AVGIWLCSTSCTLSRIGSHDTGRRLHVAPLRRSGGRVARRFSRTSFGTAWSPPLCAFFRQPVFVHSDGEFYGLDTWPDAPHQRHRFDVRAGRNLFYLLPLSGLRPSGTEISAELLRSTVVVGVVHGSDRGGRQFVPAFLAGDSSIRQHVRRPPCADVIYRLDVPASADRFLCLGQYRVHRASAGFRHSGDKLRPDGRGGSLAADSLAVIPSL